MRRYSITLRHGALRFSADVYSPEVPSSETVLALHGFPDSPLTYAGMAAKLVSAGYQVVVPVLRGYEPSSIPVKADFHMGSLAEDVQQWLDQPPLLGQRVHLIGHDWGAVVGYASLGLLGDRLASFTAMAIPPVGSILWSVLRLPRQIGLFWYQYLAVVPGLAEAQFARKNFSLIESLWRDWSPGLEPPAALLEAVRARFRVPGVLTSALRYYRGLYSYHSPARWRAERMFCATVYVPTLIINGLDDGCIDARMFGHCIRSAQFAAGVRHESLPGCGHWLHLEQPDRVCELILAHLSAASAPDIKVSDSEASP